jgi:hypothetical protein
VVGFCGAVVLPGVVVAVVDIVRAEVLVPAPVCETDVPVCETEFVWSKIVDPPVGMLFLFRVVSKLTP